MPAFPLFIDLTGKKVLVFGGGEVALRKITTLLLFKPSVEVCAEAYCTGILNLIHAGQVKKVEMVVNFDGEEVPKILDAFLVICATDNEVFNHKTAKKCHEMNIWVNSATSAGDCSFVFPAVTVRGDIVCAMTSSGSVPVLTKKIREDVESVMPEWYEELSRRLGYVRLIVKSKVSSQKNRRDILRRLTDYGLKHGGSIPEDIIREEIEKTKEDL